MPSVNEKIKTAVPTALIFGSKPVTSEVQILMGKVISKFVKKYTKINNNFHSTNFKSHYRFSKG